MLGSISPVGENSRNQRWWITATAYTVASVVGGAAIATTLAAGGEALRSIVAVPVVARSVVLALAAGTAAALDSHLFGWRLPTRQRQVNERWLETYRGWVYGAGFGAQLGLGVATVVPSAVTYAMLVAAFLSASWYSGLLIGAVFGAVRSVPLLLMAGVRSADRLYAVTRRVADAEPRAHRLTIAGQGALAAATLVAAIAA